MKFSSLKMKSDLLLNFANIGMLGLLAGLGRCDPAAGSLAAPGRERSSPAAGSLSVD